MVSTGSLDPQMVVRDTPLISDYVREAGVTRGNVLARQPASLFSAVMGTSASPALARFRPVEGRGGKERKLDAYSPAQRLAWAANPHIMP